MDFNPIIAKDDYLTNALNATLLTFNGNEMQLQQDMGNGRVETAFLPEGYIPVGTCEFGDIIYIVSYNPLENKSQIGCFPSPERNISSDEVSDMEQSLNAADFQFFNGTSPNGKLKATSVKKIIYGNKNMNPGDKYIIYEEDGGSGLSDNADTLSDYGNKAHQLNQWPKLLKLKVVSIEDSGKIVDLGASVKWYKEDYYLAYLKSNDATGKPDIDSYRSMVSSAYSVFQSKVSGKLAILAELEAIDGFSCSYDVYTERDEDKGETSYRIYFYTSWETHHNDVNPKGIIVTKSAWTDTENGGRIVVPTPGDTGYIYQVNTNKENLPVESAAENGGYNDSKVIEYSRLYKLEAPGTYDSYTTKDSFDVQIGDILDWDTNNGVEDPTDKLRPITKITRLLEIQGENALGEPLLAEGDKTKYQYVFNLDDYKVENGAITYYTNTNDGVKHKLKSVVVSDDVVNNYFHKDTPKLVVSECKFQTHTKISQDGKDKLLENDLSNLIWNYGIAPVMPYGVLDYLETTGTIDFSKLGTGKIDLSAWRYYTSGNLFTLTWGLDAYPEANKGIAEVVMDFYDNQGFAASYHVTGKSSFSGKFTDNIVLGQQKSSYRMSDTDAYGDTHVHAGAFIEEGSNEKEKIYLDQNNAPSTTESDFGPCKNDAGTLYPNMLYLVRITVKYCPKDLLGNFTTENTTGFKTFYRWVWTNGIFNQEYYNTEDFDVLQPSLGIDFSATFNTKGAEGTHPLAAKTSEYRQLTLPEAETLVKERFQTLAANVYHINQDGADDATGNVLLTLDPVLAEGYNTFNLNEEKLNVITGIQVQMGASRITKNIEPELVYSGDAHISEDDDIVLPQIAPILDSHDSSGWDRSGYAAYKYGANNAAVSEAFLALLGEGIVPKSYSSTADPASAPINGQAKEIYETSDAYQGYLDAFSLNVVGGKLVSGDPLVYTDSEGVEQSVPHYQEKLVDMKTARDTGVKLTLTGTAFSKMYASEVTTSSESKVLRSIMYKADSADEMYNCPRQMNLVYSGGHLYFRSVMVWGMDESKYVGFNGDPAYPRWCAHTYENSTVGFGSKGNEVAHWDSKDDGGWRGALNSPDKPTAYDGDDVQKPLTHCFRSPFTLFVWGLSDKMNKKSSEIYLAKASQAWLNFRSSFGMTVDRAHGERLIYSSEPMLEADLSNLSGTYKPQTILIKDVESGLVTPLSDYFMSGSGNSQVCLTSADGKVVTKTLADMLGSLLIQLYAVDPEGVAGSTILKNFVSLQQFIETWSKDIVIQVDPSEISAKDVSELITIQRQTSFNYLKWLKFNSGLSEDDLGEVSTANTEFQLYGIQRVIDFRYAVPYNLGNLFYIFSQQSQGANKIMLATLDESGNPQEAFFTNDVKEDTLYTWTGSAAVPFGTASQLVYASEFRVMGDYLYMVPSTKKINTRSFATLAKVMTYEGGELQFKGLDRFSTFDTKYTVHYNTDANSNSTYVSNIPLVSLFNEYLPRLS